MKTVRIFFIALILTVFSFSRVVFFVGSAFANDSNNLAENIIEKGPSKYKIKGISILEAGAKGLSGMYLGGVIVLWLLNDWIISPDNDPLNGWLTTISFSGAFAIGGTLGIIMAAPDSTTDIDSQMKFKLIRNTFYGVVSGGLISMIIVNGIEQYILNISPISDIGICAIYAGSIAGGIIGFNSTKIPVSNSLITIEKDRLYFSFPQIYLTRFQSNPRELTLNSKVLQVKF